MPSLPPVIGLRVHDPGGVFYSPLRSWHKNFIGIRINKYLAISTAATTALHAATARRPKATGPRRRTTAGAITGITTKATGKKQRSLPISGKYPTR